MQKIYPLVWSSSRELLSLQVEPITGIRILQHAAQPPAYLDLITAGGGGMRFTVRMEFVADRLEVGRMEIQDIPIEKSKQNFATNSKWEVKKIEAPNWLAETRSIELLTFYDKEFIVDSGVRMYNGDKELIVVGSSFPAALYIKSSNDLSGLIGIKNYRYPSEFEIGELVGRSIFS